MIILAILFAAALIPVLWVVVQYNSLVGLRNYIAESWSNVDTELKRRYTSSEPRCHRNGIAAREESGTRHRMAQPVCATTVPSPTKPATRMNWWMRLSGSSFSWRTNRNSRPTSIF